MSQSANIDSLGSILAEMEAAAVEMAHGAGEILLDRFGEALKVSYKGKGERDPVTEADRASQDFLKEAIKARFPGHGTVAEEDAEEDLSVAPDYLWILDPLDGTTNFINGLPIYATSIGVLYRGEPVVGSLLVPWPGERRGVVLHAHRGGGAYLGEESLALPETPGTEGNRLSGLPAGLGAWYAFRKEVLRRVGDARTTGSIAYELALASQGVLQYAIHTRPHIWDVAGGVAILLEAGGQVMVRRNRGREWEPMASFFPNWNGEITMKDVRGWSAAMMVSGARGTAEEVARGVKGKSRLAYRLARGMRRLF